MTPESAEIRLEAILAQFGTLLRRAIARSCPGRQGADVDDIEQDARVRVWQALRRESEIVNPASYLYRVAATATIDAIRRARALREDLFDAGRPPDAATPAWSHRGGGTRADDLVADNEARVLVDRALARLADNRRQAVRLYLSGLTDDEIADLTGWSEPKARNLVSRGMKDLRGELRAMGIDLEAQ